MDAVFSEALTYIIKFIVFAAVAVLGFAAGTKWRDSKDARQAAAEDNGENENK